MKQINKGGDCSGVRVGEITEKTNLSRPAVSHHLQKSGCAFGCCNVKNDPDCMGVFVNHDPTVGEQIMEVTI